jgi:hypothetical protein
VVESTRAPRSDDLDLRVLMHPDEEASLRPPEGYSAALDLLRDLLDGLRTPNAFVPAERHVGHCRICRSIEPLTFEHIPPRCAGNDKRARAIPMWDVVTAGDPLAFPTAGWVPSQRGVGGYVLCEGCNRTVGRKYVPEYRDFASELLQGLVDHATSAGHLPGTLDLALGGWALGDIARAGLVTQLDVAIHDRLLSLYPGLTDTVMVPGTPLPKGLRLGLTVVLGTRARLSAPICSATDERAVVFSEAALEPFAWTLSFLEGRLRPLDRTADVSHWLSHGHQQRSVGESLAVPVGGVAAPTPGDYRPKPLIEADLAASTVSE